MNRYLRNRLYINPAEQEILKNFPLFIAGSGIGSNIAECALRTGFEKICVADGDLIEDSNLNRQNYTEDRIGSPKAEALAERLKSINSRAEITLINRYLAEDDMPDPAAFKAAVNALDFRDGTPQAFDQLFLQSGIPVLHPYNLGWGAMVTVLAPERPLLSSLGTAEGISELDVVAYAAGYQRFWKKPQGWLEDVLARYSGEKDGAPPPQLAIGSWYAAAMCTHLLVKIATGKAYKCFPEFYMSSLFEEEAPPHTVLK